VLFKSKNETIEIGISNGRSSRRLGGCRGALETARRIKQEDLARDAGPFLPNAVTREQLEYLIRAAAVIVADDEIVVIGSQATWDSSPMLQN
jgi:hypothetical protein